MLHEDAKFPTTRWSQVMLAGGDRTLAQAAINGLCRVYWLPVYAFLRHQGHDKPEAEDLTQGYFVDLMGRSYLSAADRLRGRFRTFLLTDLKYFVSNQTARDRALKRGGGAQLIPIETAADNPRLEREMEVYQDPVAYFDRQWARETIRQARLQLRKAYEADRKGSLFECLEHGLVKEVTAETYSGWQLKLGMTESALKTALHRLRQRYRQAVEDQVRETVASDDDMAEEMRHLREALKRG